MLKYASREECSRHYATVGHDEVPLLKATVWTHDSGLIAEHNMPCYVCHNKAAVLTLTQTSFGGPFSQAFQPCADCQKEGWVLIQKMPRKPWWSRLLGRE